MLHRSIYAVLVFLTAILPASAQRYHVDAGQLEVSNTVGPAPFIVHITGPQEFLDRITPKVITPQPITAPDGEVLQTFAPYMSRPSTRGFSLDWGDGTVWRYNSDPGETTIDTHTYVRPGTYVIKARINGYDPYDRGYAAWGGTCTINVTARGYTLPAVPAQRPGPHASSVPR